MKNSFHPSHAHIPAGAFKPSRCVRRPSPAISASNQRSAMTRLALALTVAAVSSCSSPPKPPSVDDSTRRPVNDLRMIELQRCTGELSATRITLHEALHLSNSAVATAGSQAIAAAQRERDSCNKRSAGGGVGQSGGLAKFGANQVFAVSFKLGSATLQLPAPEAQRLVEAARGAALVVVRGRTDAASDSTAETALARRRAEAAAEFLAKSAGVSGARIRVQWQGAGDLLESKAPDASAASTTQRLTNRRVEIEVYAVAPQREVLSNAAL